jgi:drug/metabolite transporter (DMT)-like permease
MSLLSYIILFVLLALAEASMQVFLKKTAVSQIDKVKFQYYLAIICSPSFMIAMLFYALNTFLYLYLLAHLPVSVVYPITGLQKIFIILYARYMFREKISYVEYGGVLLIQIGILLIAESREL